MGVQHRLVSEFHGLADGKVITVQRWDGKEGRATIVIAVDGRITQRAAGTVADVEVEIGRVRAKLGDGITDDVARKAADVPDDFCRTCGDRYPVGAWRCAGCGRSVGRVVSGALSGARRRGDVTIPAPSGGGS